MTTVIVVRVSQFLLNESYTESVNIVEEFLYDFFQKRIDSPSLLFWVNLCKEFSADQSDGINVLEM